MSKRILSEVDINNITDAPVRSCRLRTETRLVQVANTQVYNDMLVEDPQLQDNQNLAAALEAFNQNADIDAITNLAPLLDRRRRDEERDMEERRPEVTYLQTVTPVIVDLTAEEAKAPEVHVVNDQEEAKAPEVSRCNCSFPYGKCPLTGRIFRDCECIDCDRGFTRCQRCALQCRWSRLPLALCLCDGCNKPN